MKILSNKKYNDLISKQFRGIFADVNDDNLLRENGLLYGENKELQKEIDRLNNIINDLEKWLDEEYQYYDKYGSASTGCAMGQINRTKDKLQELKGSDKE